MIRLVTGKDVLAQAKKYLGTAESPANSNNVLFNTWYYGKEVSGAAFPWCMVFVQFVFAAAGAPLPFETASCGALLRWYRDNHPERVVPLEKAEEGDIIIFDFPGGAETDHTGILEGVGIGTVTTIDGNTGAGNEANGGAVMRRTRSKSYVRACIHPELPGEGAFSPAAGSKNGAALCSPSLPVLSYGAKNEAVRALQALLALRCAAGLAVDGSFGPATKKAVLAFQKRAGIEVDGNVGPVSWGKLICG